MEVQPLDINELGKTFVTREMCLQHRAEVSTCFDEKLKDMDDCFEEKLRVINTTTLEEMRALRADFTTFQTNFIVALMGAVVAIVVAFITLK